MIEKLTIGFCGCSLTYGEALVDIESTRFSYLVGELLDLNTKNYGVRGASNNDIFLQSLDSIQKNEITIVEWTSPGRQKFYSYADHMNDTVSDKCTIEGINQEDYKLFTIIYRILDADFNQYYHISKYVTLLNSIAEKMNKKVFYMNGIFYIDPAFLDINPDVDFFNLHKRSKKILNFDNFPDEYIKKNLTTIQTYLSPIVDNKWINTTISMHSMMVDLATDKSHPGPLTQKKYAEMIVNFLKNKLYD